MVTVAVHWRRYPRCFLARSRLWRSRYAASMMNIGVQLAKRASTEIVLSFDQLIVGGACCQVVKVSMIVGVLLYSGLWRRTYLRREKQISKREFMFRISKAMSRFRGFEISRFQSGVVRLGRVEPEFEFRFEQCSWRKQIVYRRTRQGNLMRWQNIEI
jgi:hypothetical protein